MPRGGFCQPWRGEPAARLNHRAARPSAIRVRVFNDKGRPRARRRSGCRSGALVVPVDTVALRPWMSPDSGIGRVGEQPLWRMVCPVPRT